MWERAWMRRLVVSLFFCGDDEVTVK
jgi:hypothetical protein